MTEHRWPASDTLSQNETYLGQRLLYQRAGQVEEGLNDSLYGGGAKRVLRRVVLGSILVWFVSFGFAIMAALLSFGGSSSSSAGAGTAFFILSFVLPCIWFVLALVVPQTEILSDWHLLLDGKAEIADTAYGVIFRSLREGHAIPAAIYPKRVRVGPPVRGVRNMLRVEIGKYYALVSAFAFGDDLYLGWTLWRRQVPFVIVLRWLSSFSGADLGFSGPVEVEPIKAMRESVHNAVRQGVEAALAGRYIPIIETFGHEVPVEAAASAPTVSGSADAEARPVVITMLRPVDVFSVADREQVVGQAHPGVTYELISEDGVGLMVRDSTGSVALVKDFSAVARQ